MAVFKKTRPPRRAGYQVLGFIQRWKHVHIIRHMSSIQHYPPVSSLGCQGRNMMLSKENLIACSRSKGHRQISWVRNFFMFQPQKQNQVIQILVFPLPFISYLGSAHILWVGHGAEASPSQGSLWKVPSPSQRRLSVEVNYRPRGYRVGASYHSTPRSVACTVQMMARLPSEKVSAQVQWCCPGIAALSG